MLDFAAEYAAGKWSCVDGGKYTLLVALAKKPAAASDSDARGEKVNEITRPV